jgi:hypothetical protein
VQITEQRIIIDSRWFSPERDVRRSKGLHLSHVIKFIESREKKRDQNNDSLHNYSCAGFLWERVLEKAIDCTPQELWEWLFSRAMVDVQNPSVIRPGEMLLDGIYMTPDGYNVEDGCLEEWKYTNKSLRGGIEGPKFARWLKWQIPSYLKALRLTVCRLRTYFARGDYTTGEPQWVEYMITYTQQELDEVWDMILLNAAAMRRLGLVDEEAV